MGQLRQGLSLGFVLFSHLYGKKNTIK